MASVPETRYARRGGVHVAYQVLGEGPLDVLHVAMGNVPIDCMWDEPGLAGALRRLASFSRLITCDLVGFGSSDTVPSAALPAMQSWMDDLGAVLDAVSSPQAALFASEESALPVMLFAATYPTRVRALVLWSPYARFARDVDYPWGVPGDVVERAVAVARERWGTGASVELLAPSRRDDLIFRRWLARSERVGAGPGSFAAIYELFAHTDVRGVLGSIQAPTLLLRRRGDQFVRDGHAQFLAASIADGRLIELPGDDNLWFTQDTDVVIDEIQSFLTGTRTPPVTNRVLTTVLFTDIVASTSTAARLGDLRWGEVLDAHDTMVRHQLELFGGRHVRDTGDGVLATFDGPARAIECARAIRAGAQELGIEVRAGLHTGEIELRGDDIGGIAVHLAARVVAVAGAAEVFVSRTVTDLVAGSGIEFTDRGNHDLKGFDQPWQLFAVTG
jgi:class 3 adenylate cyclase